MSTAPHDTSSKLRWGILILCLLAMALSAWLSYQKLTGKIDSLAGCGKGSSCANILGSRWSVIFGSIPVSLPSFFVYLALAISLGQRSPWVRMLQLVAAWTLLGAAIWFIGLQVFEFSGFCKYCMATHGIGILVALGLFRLCAVGSMPECIMAFPLGFAAVALLALIQLLGPIPASHRVDRLAGGGDGKGIHRAGQGRLVTFLGGHKSYRVDALPHLGKPDAEHVLVKYFDYTCDSCGTVDGYLEATLKRYPDTVAVIVLPTPLNRACNTHLPPEVHDHDKACEFARYALAVWRADPTQFTGYHHWLFQNRAIDIGAAKAEAARRVGDEAFQNALTDTWGQHLIRANCTDYRLLIQNTPVMPKLLLGGTRVLQGASIGTESFISELRRNLPLEEAGR